MAILLRFLPLLFLTGCFTPRTPTPGAYRPIDPDTGKEIVNAFTIASDWMMYFGVVCMIGSLIVIIALKRPVSGGLGIIGGIGCFVFAQFLNFIGSHIIIFSLGFLALLAVCGYLYFKAVTTGLPWLEKLFKIDFNGDGNLGTLVHQREEDGEYDRGERDKEEMEALERSGE